MLDRCDLQVLQGYQDDDNIDLATVQQLNQQLRTGIIEDLYRKNEETIKNKDDRIRFLEQELVRYQSSEVPIIDIARKAKAIDANVSQISVSRALISNADSLTVDTIHVALVHFTKRPTRAEQQRLEDWLKVEMRINTGDLRLIVQ